MRFAIGRTGGYVDALTLSRGRIEPFAPFVCPECGERVIVKQGVKRRLHFAHVHPCGRGESTGHHEDKWGVRQWLQAQRYTVEQEVILGSRRADLIATRHEERIVVEIQASSLSIESYVERTRHYRDNGLDVVWLASGMQPGGVATFKPWMRAELARRHTVIVPTGQALYRFVGFPVSVRRGIGHWRPVTSFDVSPFESFYHFDTHRWTQHVRQRRMTPPYPTPQYRRLILNRLYPIGMLPALMPSHCYLPLPSLWGVHIHPFTFQMVLYLNRRERPNDSVAWSIEKTCRQCDVTPTSDFLQAFEVQWRQLLNVFDVTESVEDWHVPKTLETALLNDLRLFQGFQRFMAKSYTN
ncbi:competence protein CoiA [Exiguobacterium aurantiacum]|uniref:Competence protein CoiA family protein n=1 Tax=Exiguobacterium aurantiacum TaxID=33987 RepID=A0ABY5FKN1_9BACL|nr:competence protein CoiA family protein [Exiguobacterium aurantiacum]UTT41959.1 competence protein CoiA family protein [Exiguobacterium aurantiacum]